MMITAIHFQTESRALWNRTYLGSPVVSNKDCITTFSWW